MVQERKIDADGYGIYLYSPDVLVNFLKHEKVRSKKLLSYFNLNRGTFLRSIKQGVALPFYKISSISYTLFIAIDEAIPVFNEWEEVYSYSDYFIEVGDSNKLCWCSFAFFESNKNVVNQRPTSNSYQTLSGRTLYNATDVDIATGLYNFTIVAYKRGSNGSNQTNTDYAFGFYFTTVNTKENNNIVKCDNDKVIFGIEDIYRNK